MTDPKPQTKNERIAELTAQLRTIRSKDEAQRVKVTHEKQNHLTRLADVGLLDLHALQVSGVNVTVSSPTATQADQYFWASIASGPAAPPQRTITIELTAGVNNHLAQAIHEAVNRAL